MARLSLTVQKRLAAALICYVNMLNQLTLLCILLLVHFLISYRQSSRHKRRRYNKSQASSINVFSRPFGMEGSDSVNDEDLVHVLKNTMEELCALVKRVTDGIGEIAAYFRHESLLNDRKNQMINELMSVEDLTTVDRVRAARILVKDDDQTHMFLSLPPNAREEFVLQMLSDHPRQQVHS